jgi:hypothetical protein
MKQLFNDSDLENKAIERFEKLFDRHEFGNIVSKTSELYLSILEEENLELDIDVIIEIGEGYGHDLSNLNEEIEKNK